MKWIASISLLVLISVMFLPLSSKAEQVDLSSFDWDELITLNSRIQNELFSRPEFKEVIVPRGIYKVGLDIPAGKWTISGVLDDDHHVIGIEWGKKLDEYGTDIPSSQQIAYKVFHYWYPENNSVTWELVENTFIYVMDGSVKFTPYVPVVLGF